MNGAHDDCRDCGHWSDCATSNEPAFPAGPGDGDGDARGGLIGDGAPGLALIHAGDQRATEAAPSYPSRLRCAELGRDQRWLVSGHRLPAGHCRGRGRYSSP
jgi:hypothetical protein